MGIVGRILGIAILSAAWALPVHADQAVDQVRVLADGAIQILSDETLSNRDRRNKFRDLFVAGADIEAIGKFVLGKYRKKMIAENRMAEYQAVFKEYVVNIYASRLGSYSGESFDVGEAHYVGENEAMVKSTINSESGPIKLDWRMLKAEDDYRVIDIHVAGISMAVEQRDSFGAFISQNQGDLGALIEHLKKRSGQPSADADT